MKRIRFVFKFKSKGFRSDYKKIILSCDASKLLCLNNLQIVYVVELV